MIEKIKDLLFDDKYKKVIDRFQNLDDYEIAVLTTHILLDISKLDIDILKEFQEVLEQEFENSYEVIYDSVIDSITNFILLNKDKLNKRLAKYNYSIKDNKILEYQKKAQISKRKNSIKKIINAVKILKKQNKNINPHSIAKVANISYNTAKKYFKLDKIQELIQKTS